jgi:hypothetical protein
VKLEDRQSLKVRSEEFREWQKDFLPKKHAVLLGRTIDPPLVPPSSQTPGKGGRGEELSDEGVQRALSQVILPLFTTSFHYLFSLPLFSTSFLYLFSLFSLFLFSISFLYLFSLANYFSITNSFSHICFVIYSTIVA